MAGKISGATGPRGGSSRGSSAGIPTRAWEVQNLPLPESQGRTAGVQLKAQLKKSRNGKGIAKGAGL